MVELTLLDRSKKAFLSLDVGKSYAKVFLSLSKILLCSCKSSLGLVKGCFIGNLCLLQSSLCICYFKCMSLIWS